MRRDIYIFESVSSNTVKCIISDLINFVNYNATRIICMCSIPHYKLTMFLKGCSIIDFR